MADFKPKETKQTSQNFTSKEAGFYKNYDIRWLKEVGEEHPDFNLVAEYEAKGKEIK